MKEFDRASIKPEWLDVVEEYPEIFLEPSPDVLDWYHAYNGQVQVPQFEELCNLRYGFEMDVGWKEIIREFCSNMRKLIQKAKDNGHEIYFKTFILKEKFGEIANQGKFYGQYRELYWEDYKDLQHKLVLDSLKTCEITGKEGKARHRNYWTKTLCDEEAEKWENYR